MAEACGRRGKLYPVETSGRQSFQASFNGGREVRQQDVQRRGGVCARYPVSCLIVDLLREAEVLRPLERLRVLDMTFGEGRFYPAWRPVVYAFDVRRMRLHYRPARIVYAPCFRWREYEGDIAEVLGGVDLVVVDPPFSRRGPSNNRAPHFHTDSLTYSEAIVRSCGLAAARRFGAPLLYHYPRPLGGLGEVLAEAYLRPAHRYSKLYKKDVLTYFAVVRP